MKILILPAFYSSPGHALRGVFFGEQARALASIGADVKIVFVEPRRLWDFGLKALRENHWQVVREREGVVPVIRQKGWNTGLRYAGGGRIWAYLLERLVAAEIKKSGPPDVIHAHGALYAGYAAVNLSRRFKVPCVITAHSSNFIDGALTGENKADASHAFSGADAVIAVSSVLADAIQPYCGAKQVRVIPNLVDTEFFAVPPQPRPADKFSFIAVAQLTANKGFDRLITAFAEAFKGRPDVDLVICGDGPQAGNLRNLAANLGVADKVRFTGALSREGVRSAMWSANALVIASQFETFGIVAIEALATGIPVIATRCGGPEDIVTAKNGWLVARDNVQELAQAMLNAERERRDLTGVRDEIIRRFSAQNVAASIVAVYQGLLERTTGPAKCADCMQYQPHAGTTSAGQQVTE